MRNLLRHIHSMQQARGLRLLPPVLLAFCLLGFLFFPQSCTSIDCPVNNSVETRYTLKKATGKTDTLVYDTLWLRTTRTDGTDTTLINGIYGVSNLTVPISHTQPEDVLYLPGGMPGSKKLAQHEELMEILLDHWARGGAVAAICAAPGLVVSQLPGLEGRKFTCFEGFEDALIGKGAVYTPESTVTDGNLITGRGAGHAVNFGLAILRYLKGDEAAEKVKAGLML